MPCFLSKTLSQPAFEQQGDHQQEHQGQREIGSFAAFPERFDVDYVGAHRGELGSKLGLSNDFVYRAIKLVGNYGEVYERNLASYGLARGQNDLWTNGGLMYAPPLR